MKLKVFTKYSDIQRIRSKLNAVQERLSQPDGFVLKYLWTYVALDYRDAVMSGMGSIPAGDVLDTSYRTGSLKPFLGSSVHVRWKPLSPYTMLYKMEHGMNLSLWMATGATARAVKVFKKNFKYKHSIFAGIDAAKNREEYLRALEVEFGANGKYDGRALFTLMNDTFVENIPVIRKNVQLAIREAIRDAGWGS